MPMNREGSLGGNPEGRSAEAVKIYPEISFEQEWDRQAQNLARLFAKELKFNTPEEYIATLPKFKPQPENFKGRLDTPVLIETRITPQRQCELVGIEYALNRFDGGKWEKDPKDPCAVWLGDGRSNLNKKSEDVRKNLKDDECGGTEFDGIALYIFNLEILEHHFLDLPGVTPVNSVSSACLDLRLRDGRPTLRWNWVNFPRTRSGSVVRGRQK